MTSVTNTPPTVHADLSSDERDVARAAGGDPDAFERLYRATVDRVYALARRMAGEDVAEDLTQEVYLRAWRKLGTFRGDASFATWLHRLAVNLILSRRETLRKREARHVQGEGLLETLAARVKVPGLRLDMEAAMGKLPEGARRVFVLYDVEGYSHEEIAGTLGISVGTSKSQLHRARMMLRGHLN
jgi:RNA polymerase sigma-70 factor (ECF subfamily)